MKTFRFDDICINSDMNLVNDITDYLYEKFDDCEVIYGVSPMVHNDCGQRVFPKIFNALSDHKNFYRTNRIGLPEMYTRVTKAGHGLIHIDHRLLTKEVQEFSIVASCSVVNSKMFIPPFNKWNSDTEWVCKTHGLTLIKFEDGWKSMEHNTYDKSDKWYLHAREWDMDKIKQWFNHGS